MYTAVDLFDLSQTEHAPVFADDAPAWEALPRIAGYLAAKLQPAVHATVSPQALVGDHVFLGEGTIVEPGAYIEGPAIFGRNCQIRHGAYVRANVIVGDGCVVHIDGMGEGLENKHHRD